MTGNTNGLSATPSQYNGSPDRPVEKVSWNDVQIFLDRLNSQESNNTAAGWKYALPTEAEWEYACRANTTTAYFWEIAFLLVMEIMAIISDRHKILDNIQPTRGDSMICTEIFGNGWQTGISRMPPLVIPLLILSDQTWVQTKYYVAGLGMHITKVT